MQERAAWASCAAAEIVDDTHRFRWFLPIGMEAANCCKKLAPMAHCEFRIRHEEDPPGTVIATLVKPRRLRGRPCSAA